MTNSGGIWIKERVVRGTARKAWVIGALFEIWFACSALLDAVLMSYHQPFRTPIAAILDVANVRSDSGWNVVHFISGSCACSQRVMQHLLQRHRLTWAAEEVVLVDSGEPYLPHSEELVEALARQGFQTRHMQADELPERSNLRGVPMLLVVSPENQVVYLGGYGNRKDSEAAILRDVHAGSSSSPLPILGCAVGMRLRRSLDPFHLKYR